MEGSATWPSWMPGRLSTLFGIAVAPQLWPASRYLVLVLSFDFFSEMERTCFQRFLHPSGGSPGGTSLPAPICLVSNLLTDLKHLNLGVSIGNTYCGVLAYADDFAFMSTLAWALQLMLDRCHQYSFQCVALFI